MQQATDRDTQPKQKPAATFEAELLQALPRLRGIAIMLTRDRTAADDLLQDALVLALSAKESYELGTNMSAWMYRLMRNRLISVARKRRPTTMPLTDEVANHVSVAANQPGRLLQLELERELALLPVGQREALILVGAAGESYADAAVALGCTVGTVKSRVSRARDTLRQRLDGEDAGTVNNGETSRKPDHDRQTPSTMGVRDLL